MQTAHPAQMEIQPLPLKARLLPRAKLPLRQVQMEATVMAAIIPLLTETTPQTVLPDKIYRGFLADVRNGNAAQF